MGGQANPIARWMGEFIGPGKPFANRAEFARAAGVHYNTILNAEKGKVDPDTLIKMSRAAGETPLRLMYLAGLFTDEDIDDADSLVKTAASAPALAMV